VRDTKPENEKLAKRGRGLGQMTYYSNLGPSNISGTAEDTNLKFRTWIESKGPDSKRKCKTGQNGA